MQLRSRSFSRAAVFALAAVPTLSMPAPAQLRAADPPANQPAASAREGHSPYQPQGAPADPKVPARWNTYRDHAAATKLLEQLAAAYPELARLTSLGKSYGGRDMWVLTITNPKTGKETEKPAFWIDGGIHANEIQGPEVALYTAWYLLEAYGRQEFVTRLLDQRVFYILPMLSPDSRDAHMHEPNSTHGPRSGQRPRDDDRDGLVDEDGPDDLDGDGHITQMRLRDPNGRWKPHPDFPELLVECKPDERGQYTLLDTEGYDNDGDGEVDEDGNGYYDPNRNWPYGWQPPGIQHGSDRYPLSIAEDRMVADFIMAHANIAGAQSYHNAGGMILRPPGAKSENLPHSDLEVYKLIGKKGELILPGYRSLDTGKELYEVLGGELDWLYSAQGIFAFTNELFTGYNLFGQKSDDWFGRSEEQHQFNKYVLLGDGFVAWHEVDHPQFGKIEVGGFKKNWVRQPPSFMLEQECHRNMAFTLYHADQMPLVELEDVIAKPLPGGLTQISATVINRKLIPTHAASDVTHKLTPPDHIRLAGPKLKVLAALTADDVLFEKPREQKREPAEVRLDTLRGMKPVYIRWIVSGEGPWEIEARSVKGGVARKSGA